MKTIKYNPKLETWVRLIEDDSFRVVSISYRDLDLDYDDPCLYETCCGLIVEIDHYATGTKTPGTGDTVVRVAE